MKHSQLKALIKEIVAQVMDAKTQKPAPYEEVQGWSFAEGYEQVVDFEGVLLPDGREVNISVEFGGRWDDGAFDFEQGSIRGTHRYPVAFEMDGGKVTYAEDTATKQPVQLDPAIVAAGEALLDRYEDDIRQNMPEPNNEPDPEDRIESRRQDQEFDSRH